MAVQLHLPETPHFVRTVFPELLCLGRIEIPKGFIRKYGRDLLNWVLLKIPTGETWTVELVRGDERVWLGRGWKNFMERNSILADYSIAFGFVGNSMFHTFICDQDGYQVDGPVRCSCRARVNCKDEFPTSGNGAGRSSPVISIGDSGSSAEVRSESGPSDEVDSDFAAYLSATQPTHRSSAEVPTESEPSDEADPTYAAFLSTTRANHRSGRRRRIRNAAFAAAFRFTSNKPFFRVQMRDCYRSHIVIKKATMESCNLKVGRNAVTLVHMGQRWPVTMSNAEHRGSGWIGRGWAAFKEGTNLKEGDMCILELVAPNLFKVVIFRS